MDLPIFLVDSAYLKSTTTYQIYCTITEAGTNSNNSFYNNTASKSSSHFYINSTNSSHPADFTFTIDNGTYNIPLTNGCSYFSQVNTNKIYVSEVNTNLINVNEIRGTGNNYLTNLDVSGTTNLQTATLQTATLPNVNTLAMSTSIDYSSSPFGQFKLLVGPVNWNLNNGGSMYSHTHTGGSGFWWYIFSDTKTTETGNLMILMYFTSTSSKSITIFNNNSSVNWTVTNSSTAPTITIRNSYGSGTNWYLYGLKFF
jgi:hypothetical protein